MALSYTPAPGPQRPDLYQVPVGPNYKKYGEQAGFIYVPQFDKYYVNPKTLKEQYQQQGLVEQQKEPSLAQGLIPIAATLGTATLAQEGAKALPGLLGLGGGEAAKSVAQKAATSALGTDPAPAIQAATSGGSGAFSLGGIGSAGNAILPAAGLLGAGDLLINQRKGARGVVQGAGSGAAIGSYFGPAGAGIGAGIGGLIGLGNSLLARKSTKEIQADRWNDAGHGDLAGTVPDYFAGTGGEQSRDEKLLTPDAIRVNPDNYNNVPEWDKWTKEQQNKFLQTLLSEGKVREKKGGIYYDDQRAQQIADSIRKGLL